MTERAPRTLGARCTAEGTVFGAYTTLARSCAVRRYDASGRTLATDPMPAVGGGHHELLVPEAKEGTLYKFVLDDRELPDPYARFLPRGVHGPAQVVEGHHVFRHARVAVPLAEQVIYELHVGTFTPEGTYDAARARLEYLAGLGVRTIELMPLAAFDGSRGWGYDGVALFAPFAPYGTPDSLRRLVDAAHGAGLAVILDVVHNHFGPSGNYLAAYSGEYFAQGARPSPWGAPPNFASPAMRRYAVDSALYWIDEFRFDGLRLDAIQTIADPSGEHLVHEIARRAREHGATMIYAEDDRNDPDDVDVLGLDGVWADDFHHGVRVTLTGERDGYYAGYAPGPAGIAETIRGGWLYEGETFPPTGEPRGKPATSWPAAAFVYCLQNHDQVGNRALGDRLSASISPEAYCAVTMLLLFLPMTPLLFMGQEWAASTPFLYFTDHEGTLGAAIVEGRRSEFRSFGAFRDPEKRARIPDPQALATFEACRLRWGERTEGTHAAVLSLYRDLLSLRRSDVVLRESGRGELSAHAAGDVLVVRRALGADARWLCVNFGVVPIGRSTLDLPPALVTLRASHGDLESRDLPPCTAVILAGRA